MATPRPAPKTEKNIDGYGSPPVAWEKVRDRIDKGLEQAPGDGGPDRHTCWLTTINPDGRPHVTPVGTRWIDDTFYFTSGAATRKGKNLARDPRCVIACATHDFDLVVEGSATKVTDRATLERMAEAFRAEGWPAEVLDDVPALTGPFSAPSAGPAPWELYALKPETVYALGTVESFGSEKWTF